MNVQQITLSIELNNVQENLGLLQTNVQMLISQFSPLVSAASVQDLTDILNSLQTVAKEISDLSTMIKNMVPTVTIN